MYTKKPRAIVWIKSNRWQLLQPKNLAVDQCVTVCVCVWHIVATVCTMNTMTIKLVNVNRYSFKFSWLLTIEIHASFVSHCPLKMIKTFIPNFLLIKRFSSFYWAFWLFSIQWLYQSQQWCVIFSTQHLHFNFTHIMNSTAISPISNRF